MTAAVKQPLEAEVSRLVARAIGAKSGFLLLRNNNGVLTDINGRPVKFGLGVGTPDFVGIFKLTLKGVELGAVVGFEIKRPGGKLSEEQVKSHALWRSFGARIHVVHSEAEAFAAYSETCCEFQKLMEACR